MGAGGRTIRICQAVKGLKEMKDTPKIYKMRIVFRCAENAARDKNVFNAVRKMVLDSGLPYEPAKVNKNWPRLAYGPAPAQGQRAEREYLDIYLREHCSEDGVRQALQQAAPNDLELLQVMRVPYPLPSVQNLAAAVRYRVKGDFSSYISTGQKIEDWAGKGELFVVLRAENGMACQQKITPFLLEAKTLSPDEIELTLAGIDGKWLPPQWFVAAWLGQEISLPNEVCSATEGFTFIRQGFYWKDSQGELHLI